MFLSLQTFTSGALSAMSNAYLYRDVNFSFNDFPMTTISKDNNYLTLINVFKVAPENQQKLVELLIHATESVKNISGFISSSLHRSMDGTRVTMYAQWRSQDDYNRMRANPSASPFLDQALQMATFEPGMYEVVETFTGL
jgi:quinol monooxygenase YgiN